MPDFLPLSEVMARHGLTADKSLGQHFLFDKNLLDRIVRAAGDVSGVHILEVGPGPGGLTRALLRSDAASVLGVEMDARCVAALEESLGEDKRLQILRQDALTLDVEKAMPQTPRAVVANLPYNVATPLILGWIEEPYMFQSITVLIQKEVAQRLCAAPRSKLYGRLSVMAQWRCSVSIAFDVRPEAFTPPPKVMSSVVYLHPCPVSVAAPSWSAMELTVKTSFAQRRKMLRKTLKPLFGEETEAILESHGIAPTARAEELTIADFVALATVTPRQSQS